MEGGVSLQHGEALYLVSRGLGEAYAGLQPVALRAVTGGLAAPRTPIDPYFALLDAQHGAVIVQQVCSCYVFAPQAGMGTFPRTAFAEEEDGPFVAHYATAVYHDGLPAQCLHAIAEPQGVIDHPVVQISGQFHLPVSFVQPQIQRLSAILLLVQPVSRRRAGEEEQGIFVLQLVNKLSGGRRHFCRFYKAEFCFNLVRIVGKKLLEPVFVGQYAAQVFTSDGECMVSYGVISGCLVVHCRVCVGRYNFTTLSQMANALS